MGLHSLGGRGRRAVWGVGDDNGTSKVGGRGERELAAAAVSVKTSGERERKELGLVELLTTYHDKKNSHVVVRRFSSARF